MTNLSSLEIKFINENEEVIALSEGQPSIIKVHASSSDMNQIHVRVNSKGTDSFPNNIPSKFSIRLAKPLNLSGNWQVAVSSIIYRNDFQINSDLDLMYKIIIPEDNENSRPAQTKFIYIPNTLTNSTEIVFVLCSCIARQ